MRLGIGIVAFTLVGAGAIGIAQTEHTQHGEGMDHAMHGQAATDGPVLMEPGQGAFAALSEVVRVLETEPETDWSRVDLSGLRAHLVDMDRLVTHAVVTEEVLPNGLRTIATGDAETVETLRRMVPAHAAQLARDDRWSVAASETADGMALQVTSDIRQSSREFRGSVSSVLWQVRITIANII